MKIFIRIAFAIILGLGSLAAYGQTASLLPNAKQTFLDNNGNPLSSGTVTFYIPATSTLKTTWQDANQSVANTNPVVLDSAGRAIIYGDGSYRQVVKDQKGNTIWDGLTSSTGSGGGGSTGDGEAVGTIKPYAGLVAPTNYLFSYGQEVSRATYANLFTAITLSASVTCTSGSPILTSIADTTQIPIGANIEVSCVAPGATVSAKTTTTITVTSNALVSTTTTAVIFAYGNGDGSTTFNLPDMRGRAVAGRDNMGGSAANRLTSTYFGETASAVGATGGTESQTLVTGNLPAYTPSGTIIVDDPGHNHQITNDVTNTFPGVGFTLSGSGDVGIGTATTTTSFTGLNSSNVTFTGTAQGGTSTAFSIIQPTITLNYIIKVIPDSGGGGGGGGGSVTSVALTMPGGIFGVTGSPITSSGTLAVSVTGTSGGIPYFDSGSTLASSAALTLNAPIIGGGAGGAPSVGTRSGNTTAFVTLSGAATSGMCAQFDASGNIAATGSACGSGGGGGTPGGSNTQVQFNNAGSFGASANLTWVSPALTIGAAGSTTGQLKLTGSASGTITIQAQASAGTYNFNLPTSAGSANQVLTSQAGGATAQTYQNIVSLLTAGTGISISGTTNATIALTTPVSVANGGTGTTTFTANAPLLGNGTSAIAQGSRSGNTTVFGTVSGSVTAGNCIQADASGNLVDAGTTCSGGGGGGPPTASVDTFIAPGDFTPGSTTVLTLSGSPASEAITFITFDGIVQSQNTYSIAASTLTFAAVIPTSVAVVQVQWYTGGGGGGAGTVASSTANNLAYYATSGDTVSGLATANNGTLVTSGAGVPSISSTLPTAVQTNITGTGTLLSGATGAGFTLNFTASTLSGLVPAANLPTATSAALGVMRGDGSTLTIGSGIVSCTTATTSQIGCSRVDDIGIGITAGVLNLKAITNNRFVGNVSGGVASPIALTAGQLNAVLSPAVIDAATEYSVVCDGVTNTTTAINNAIAAAAAGARKIVQLPGGLCLITPTITISGDGITLRGNGVGMSTWSASTATTRIVTTNTTSNMLTISGSYVTLQNFTIGGTDATTRTAGACLNISGFNNRVINVFLLRCYGGILDSGNVNRYDGVSMRDLTPNGTSANSYGIRISGTGGAGSSDTHIIDNMFISTNLGSNPAFCVDLVESTTVLISNSEFLQCNNGLYAHPGSSAIVLAVNIVNTYFDTTSGSSILLQPTGTGQIFDFNMSNSWVSPESGNNGITINATAGEIFNVVLTGNTMNTYGAGTGAGVFVQGTTKGVNMNGNTIVAFLAGISIDANVNNFSITNNMIGNYRGGGGTTTPVNVAAGTSNNYIISYNMMQGNTNPLFDGGTGVSKIVGNNICGASPC